VDQLLFALAKAFVILFYFSRIYIWLNDCSLYYCFL